MEALELTSAVVFIGAVIVAVTQFVKYVAGRFGVVIDGDGTIGIAVLVGVLVTLLDVEVGVEDVTVAQGVLIALGAVGTLTGFSKIAGSSTTTTKKG